MFRHAKPVTEADLVAIEERALRVVPIGYLVTALTGSLAPEKGEEQAYVIAELCRDDIPALIAEIRRLRAEGRRDG